MDRKVLLEVKDIDFEISDLIVQAKKYTEHYLASNLADEFIPIANESTVDKITRIEGTLDRLSETNSVRELLIKTSSLIVDEMFDFIDLFKSVVSICEDEEPQIIASNNTLVSLLLQTEQEKTDEEIGKKPTKKSALLRKLEWRKDEIRKLEMCEKERISFSEIQPIHPMLSPDNIMKMEMWSKLKVKSVVFDSNIDNWNKDNSVFSQKIVGLQNFSVFIKDVQDNIFGVFIREKVTKRSGWVTDKNSFVFKLKSNSKTTSECFFANEDCLHMFAVFDDDKEGLFAVGDGHDIAVRKKGIEGSYCSPKSFQYTNGGDLCGGKWFVPYHIVVLDYK
ncbi:hypothetical protein EIN_081640 [Entamoeba invadens IP1]|uniref:hypothetical protein n=1 Tax=Entamoeba invadens IP1 TaxID=370355 RepID=UPI0002C3E47C|nr:hypothetical protein EIN_081640 [Entamoeba invadens IP1]ELP85132.1 hypothetical protein EIN_081640 [Entamoeba invadens IP1]|eukprot:XP_004184478.1 hypothetical protein EIN_081640 [Entamoeba invadens IP1]